MTQKLLSVACTRGEALFGPCLPMKLRWLMLDWPGEAVAAAEAAGRDVAIGNGCRICEMRCVTALGMWQQVQSM